MEDRFTPGKQPEREDGCQRATRTTDSPRDNLLLIRDEEDAQVQAELPPHLFKLRRDENVFIFWIKILYTSKILHNMWANLASRLVTRYWCVAFAHFHASTTQVGWETSPRRWFLWNNQPWSGDLEQQFSTMSTWWRTFLHETGPFSSCCRRKTRTFSSPEDVGLEEGYTITTSPEGPSATPGAFTCNRPRNFTPRFIPPVARFPLDATFWWFVSRVGSPGADPACPWPVSAAWSRETRPAAQPRPRISAQVLPGSCI